MDSMDWNKYSCLIKSMTTEIVKTKCNVCGKMTEHHVKEHKDSFDYKCTVCKKIYSEPKEIKKEYLP
jgi:hypothetical protein